MRVFISWSGEQSHQLANALRDWLPNVLQALNPWVSSSDIEKGESWFASISDALVKAEGVGIFCLTRENLGAPWLAFEAGALAGSDRARVATLRFRVASDEVKPPLSLFQATDAASSMDVLKLVETLNARLPSPLTEGRLKIAFDTHWPSLEAQLQNIKSAVAEAKVPTPSPTDLMQEILAVVRRIEKDHTAPFISPGISYPFEGGLLSASGGAANVGLVNLGLGRSTVYGGGPPFPNLGDSGVSGVSLPSYLRVGSPDAPRFGLLAQQVPEPTVSGIKFPAKPAGKPNEEV